MSSEIKRAVIECMLVSLEARKEQARHYVLNTTMQLEVELLRKQIQALAFELKENT